MKYVPIIFCFVLFSFNLFSQTPLKLVKYETSECEMDEFHRKIQSRIIEQSLENEEYNVKIGTIANCAGISQISAKLVNDTIFVSYNEGQTEYYYEIQDSDTVEVESSEIALCDCCFDFSFTFSPVCEMPRFVKINDNFFAHFSEKYVIFPVSFDILNGDTINFRDKYGLKQGFWNKIDTIDKINYTLYVPQNITYKLDIYYENNSEKYGTFVVFYSDGKTDYLTEFNNFKEVRTEYRYPNGNLKHYSTEFGDFVFYENGYLKREILNKNKTNCHYLERYFYENGNIMSVSYMKNDNFIQEYYDINGNKTTRQELIRQGYGDILKSYRLFY